MQLPVTKSMHRVQGRMRRMRRRRKWTQQKNVELGKLWKTSAHSDVGGNSHKLEAGKDVKVLGVDVL